MSKCRLRLRYCVFWNNVGGSFRSDNIITMFVEAKRKILKYITVLKLIKLLFILNISTVFIFVRRIAAFTIKLVTYKRVKEALSMTYRHFMYPALTIRRSGKTFSSCVQHIPSSESPQHIPFPVSVALRASCEPRPLPATPRHCTLLARSCRVVLKGVQDL